MKTTSHVKALHLGLRAVGWNVYHIVICSVCQEVRKLFACAEAAEEPPSLLKMATKVSLVTLLLSLFVHLLAKYLCASKACMLCAGAYEHMRLNKLTPNLFT